VKGYSILGAQAGDVLRLIVSHGMYLTLIGTIIGLAMAFAVTRLLASFLYDISVTNPMIFTGVSLFLISVGLFACCLPAWRATKIDPMALLRHELSGATRSRVNYTPRSGADLVDNSEIASAKLN
jgi:ABC-type antimicrobial peptide transport system permease subunit